MPTLTWIGKEKVVNHSWYFRNALVRANYQNVQKGIMRNAGYLELFFRNLLLGETNELRNRYMLVNAPEELRAEQVQRFDRTSTEQPAVQVTEQVRALLSALSDGQLSLKALMERVGLKHRPTFLENYIAPLPKPVFSRCYIPTSPITRDKNICLRQKGWLYITKSRKCNSPDSRFYFVTSRLRHAPETAGFQFQWGGVRECGK